jgi:hypothetical protein
MMTMATANPEEVSRIKQLHARYKPKIDRYRRKLDVCIKANDVYEIEKILNNINETE